MTYYSLARIKESLTLLDWNRLIKTLQHIIAQHPNAKNSYLFDFIDSTSRFLMQHATQSGDVCVANQQTEGKGRADHIWESPAGGIYYSLAWVFPDAVSMENLSLFVGIVTAKTLRPYLTTQPMLKWPNDILINQKKCGGILIESRPKEDCKRMAIIGIGLNYHLQKTFLKQDRTALIQHTQHLPDREILTGELITTLLSALQDFSHKKAEHWMQEWGQLDALSNHVITFESGTNRYSGIARGIDSSGALCVEIDGTIQMFHQAHHVRIQI